ncbi:DUF4157 domain-containing protein [Geobacter sp.]|uniref:eCIS core domain-containing protein n=1 Tax=Geobacter sp. TaxID=46610 RepID=UPI0027B8C9EE|nr:DUF4157 domain-containing protein [Geobacter sp.]
MRQILRSPGIQTKLAIGAPDDIHEQEADRLADQVMRMPESVCPECIEGDEVAHTTETGGQALEAPYGLETGLDALKGSGTPLSQAERSFFEPRFGADFSRVRLHTGPAAEEMAGSLNARAFTVGTDIAFGAGEYAPATAEGQGLLAHELTHVVQQSEGGHHAQHVQRGPPPGSAQPQWAITSSVEPLPGVPVPGYEQPRASYTERDQDVLLEALVRREAENEQNSRKFLKDYSSALTDLWARYATEAMAATAEESGWSGVWKVFSWFVKESLISIAGWWVARYAVKAVEFAKLLTSGAGELVTDLAEDALASSEVQAKRAVIDGMTKELTAKLEELFDAVGGLVGGEAPYAGWVKDPNNLPDLGRFRIPPWFPPTPTEIVRAAVAQTIVGLLHGDFLPYAGEEHAITLALDAGPGNFVRRDRDPLGLAPGLVTSKVLAQELIGRPIKDMPKVPLHISLICKDPPVDFVRAALGRMTLKPVLEPELSVTGSELGTWRPVDPFVAFVRAYPSTPPMTILRKVSGEVYASDGGLWEDLYLYQLANPGKNFESIIDELEQQRVSEELEGAETGALSESEMLSPETLASQVHVKLLRWKTAGAEIFISEIVESMTL